jgi:hypothetical protein
MDARWIFATTLALGACTDHGPRPAPTFTAHVPKASHATTIAVPWWWRGPDPPPPELCARMGGDTSQLADDRLTPALLTIDRQRIVLGDAELLALADGELPPNAATDRELPALHAALTAAIQQHRVLLAACGRQGAPIDLLLAVAPGTPMSIFVAALISIRRADVRRVFLLAAGGSGRPASQAPFTRDEARAELRRDNHWFATLDDDRDERPLGPSLAALQPALGERRLGCVDLTIDLTPWDQLFADLDALTGLGARRFDFTLTTEKHPAPGPATDGEPVAVTIGATVPAFPLIDRQAHVVDNIEHGSEPHPCEAYTVQRATPAQLEAAHELTADSPARW